MYIPILLKHKYELLIQLDTFYNVTNIQF